MRYVALALPMLAIVFGVAQAQNAGRPDVIGMRAAVVSGHPLATAAAYDVLRRGGNAVDAAISAAVVISVARPHMNGLGGDAFILIYDASDGSVHALNGSGRAGARATPQFFAGMEAVPTYGVLSVTVPGAPRAWADALERFGTLSWAEALEPAIGYARHGIPVSARLRADIEAEATRLREDPEAFRIFMPGGEVPAFGSVLKRADLAATLGMLAEEGVDAFYSGAIAERIVLFMEAEGGLIEASDLASHTSTWTDPIETDYLGYRVLEFPPNTQGVALLEQMNIAENFDLRGMGRMSADYVHTLIELKKLAFADRDAAVTDPEFADIPLDKMLSKEYARDLAQQVDPARAASEVAPRVALREGEDDTIYLTVVDEEGNAVSLIQSLFHSFGSGRVVPGTGIVLQNRGALFSLDPEHVNVIAPGKRTYHTLNPAMVMDGDRLLLTIGTPGGDGQTQTMLRVLNDVLMFGMRPQAAIEAPRWRSYPGTRVIVEPGFAPSTIDDLRRRGHEIELRETRTPEFGNAQMILIDRETGVRITGADLRREAYAIAY